MLTRQQRQIPLEAAKRHLKLCGWSYRTAAPVLGVRFEHLCRVLNGQRESKALLQRVVNLSRRAE
jgi:hypothetical protein